MSHGPPGPPGPQLRTAGRRKRLLLLPSDDDLDGVRLGTIELEIPMRPMGDAEHPAQLDPWTEEEENGSEEYEHRHSEL